jgi:hypothetical protein
MLGAHVSTVRHWRRSPPFRALVAEYQRKFDAAAIDAFTVPRGVGGCLRRRTHSHEWLLTLSSTPPRRSSSAVSRRSVSGRRRAFRCRTNQRPLRRR